MIRNLGTLDPTSEPEKLPPAFYKFFYDARLETDPVEAFLTGGKYVKVDMGGMMLLKTFKELYQQFRTENDFGKGPRFGPDVYRAAFTERQTWVVHHDKIKIDDTEYFNVDVIEGLVPV